MKIDKEDYEELCAIARELNEDETQLDLWERLNDVIQNIED